MHVSGSRVMDKCIIRMCIMVTFIRINNICITHAYKHQGKESYIHASFRTSVSHRKISHHRFMHHTYMHASEPRSSTIDMCIIHTCIRVNDQGKLINASYMHVSGSRVMDKCNIGICIMVTCIRIKNICIAHAYMLQDQG